MHLLHKAPLGKGEQPWQGMAILIKLRNEITHYKSQWGQQMERKDLFNPVSMRSRFAALPRRPSCAISQKPQDYHVE
jgi:hypothetical protein